MYKHNIQRLFNVFFKFINFFNFFLTLTFVALLVAMSYNKTEMCVKIGKNEL